MFRVSAQCCVLVLAAMSSALAASTPIQTGADVTSVKVTPGEGEAVITVDCSRPPTPKLETVEGPLRLVIDLPGATLSARRKRIPFRNQQIKSVRLNQYQANPPIARIVVDLAVPVRYSWDVVGNRLNIRVRPDEASSARPPTVPAASAGVQPIAVPYAEGSSGTLVEAGSRVGSGSSISAQEETAVLRLTRGGEVRVCPGTTVSVASSANGQDLMLGMGTGSIETHYHLEESSDSVLTPDFRIVLPGPGEFNLAIKTDFRGDTCVSSQPGSTSSVVVAELLGTATYEVKPLQGVVFREGRMQSVEAPLASCGCPPPPVPVLQASATDARPVPDKRVSNPVQLAASGRQPSAAAPAAKPGDDRNSVDPGQDSTSEQAKAQLTAPLIFSGKEREKLKSITGVPPIETAQALPLSTKQVDPLPAIVVLPPPPALNPPSKGFFKRIKGLFGSMFR